MPPLKKARWERFALAYFGGKSATESARIAGYVDTGAGRQGVRLTQNVAIQARINELQEMAAVSKVMTVIERKERLSEIARGRYADFVTAGPDGSWIDIGPEKINSAAICEVKTRTEYDDDGDKPSVIMSVKLHDPIRAIAELNKMEHIYEQGGNIRDINIVFVIGKGYRDAPQLVEGKE
jgi:hypothetical protein